MSENTFHTFLSTNVLFKDENGPLINLNVPARLLISTWMFGDISG